jgi:hypothetical protein
MLTVKAKIPSGYRFKSYFLGEKLTENFKVVKKYTISEILSLKLEENETVIYIKGKKFIQCKHLFLDIPLNEDTGE